MSEAKKNQARKELAVRAEMLDKAQRDYLTIRERLYRWLEIGAERGLTLREMAEIIGKSNPWVKQVLDARKKGEKREQRGPRA